MLFIRQTSDEGYASVLGRPCLVDRHWLHRLGRVELDLAERSLESASE